MRTYHIRERGRIRRNTADVQALLTTRLAVDSALRLDYPEHLQVRPLLGIAQAIQLAECPATADLQSAMILFDRFDVGVG